MIMLKANKGPDGKLSIKVETREVPLENLEVELGRLVTDLRKTEMAIEATGVEWGTIVAILDAAGGAKIHKVHFVKRGGGAPAP
jgi:biopolymer transport protein ExbD